MHGTAQRVFVFALALWVGSLITIGYIVAPALFITLEDPQAAGTVAGIAGVSEVLDNMCFSDYIDRITFQKQIWQFNEMSSLIKTFKNNKLYHETFTLNGINNKEKFAMVHTLMGESFHFVKEPVEKVVEMVEEAKQLIKFTNKCILIYNNS